MTTTTHVTFQVRYMTTFGVAHGLNFKTLEEARACNNYPRNKRRTIWRVETLRTEERVA